MKFINQGWYPIPIILIETKEEWEAEIKRRNIIDRHDAEWPGNQNGCAGHCKLIPHDGKNCSRVYIFIFPGDRSTIEIIGTILHESVHAWQFIKDHIGEQGPCIEIDAYSIQYISTALLECVKNSSGASILPAE